MNVAREEIVEPADLVEQLRRCIYADDHERGCQGRQYTCSCGYDDRKDTIVLQAADLIERLSNTAEVEQEPVAWRVRLGDSDIWSYAENEGDIDWIIQQSGLKKFEKQPLFAAPPPPVQQGEERLREAVAKLVNEVSECWAAEECALRNLHGNNNYNVVRRRLDEVRALLPKQDEGRRT